MKTNQPPEAWRDTIILGKSLLLAGHKEVNAGLAIIETAREEFNKVSLRNDTKRK